MISLNPRNCSDCPAPISPRSKGRCRRCTTIERNRSPEMRAAASVLMKRLRSDPNFDTAPAKRVEAMKAFYAIPENRAKLLAAGDAGRRSYAIPKGYEALVRTLNNKRLPRGEARRLLEQQVQADARRTIRATNEAMRVRDERRKREAY